MDERGQGRTLPEVQHTQSPTTDTPSNYTAGSTLVVPRFNGRALCAETDPELFFPEKGARNLDARRVCAACEVQPDCLAWAVATGERHGIWGGMSEMERRRLRLGAPGPRRGRAVVPCGTEAGYRRHMRAGKPACEPCLQAHRLYTAERRRAHRSKRGAA